MNNRRRPLPETTIEFTCCDACALHAASDLRKKKKISCYIKSPRILVVRQYSSIVAREMVSLGFSFDPHVMNVPSEFKGEGACFKIL